MLVVGGFLATASKHLTFLFTEVFLGLRIIQLQWKHKEKQGTAQKRRKDYIQASSQIVLRDKGKNRKSRKEGKWREKMKIIMKEREIKKNEKKGEKKIVTPSQAKAKPSLAQRELIIKTVPAPTVAAGSPRPACKLGPRRTRAQGGATSEHSAISGGTCWTDRTPHLSPGS